MAGEYVPGSGGKDCNDYPTWGTPSTSYYYIFKGNAKEEDYPEEACTCLLYTSPSPRDA